MYQNSSLRHTLALGAFLVLAMPAANTVAGKDRPDARAPQTTNDGAGGGTPPSGLQAGADDAIEQVIVTGSRLITDGSQAPTPVTVVEPGFLKNLAPTVAQGLQTLPQFSNSITTNRRQPQAGPGQNGNFLNLRGLGSARTLVLVDGVRVPGSSTDGSVDSNTIPTMLVQRVDVVTGGASAAYGSDAVSGVVNFILDRNFTGFKASAQVGRSPHGDAGADSVGVAYGGSFGDGRLRLLASAEYEDTLPIRALHDREIGEPRYLFTGAGTATAATPPGSAANPWRITPNTIFSNTSFGGVATSGPFAGQQFLPGGALAPFVPPTPTGLGGISQGDYVGGGPFTPTWLTTRLRNWKTFARGSMAVTDSIDAWVQGSYVHENHFNGSTSSDFRLGNITIFSGNAFLTAAQQAALGATPSFTLSRLNEEIGPTPLYSDAHVWNVMAGLEGVFFGDWGWNVHAVHGKAGSLYRGMQANNVHLFAAIDAVRDPSGAIVCRVTLTHPGLYPGCVPINLFGSGSPSDAAIDYIRDEGRGKVLNKTTAVSAALNGTPFSTWAGPVGLAAGLERRSLSFDQTATNPGLPSTEGIRGVPASTAWFYTLSTPIGSGSVDVSEGFAETVIPLANDAPGLRSLTLDLAGRVTDYSTSGSVKTWKLGVSWSPFYDLRFRATKSFDIRAPDLNALYLGSSTTPMVVPDPHTNLTQLLTTTTGGNINLEAERADSYVIGAVYTPSWLDTFRISADYYSIDISDAIVSQSAVQILAICEQSGGLARECQNINRPLPFSDRSPANYPTSIFNGFINAALFRQKGLDFEISYAPRLLGGTLSTRLFGTWLMSYESQSSAVAPLFELAGQGGAIDGGGGAISYPHLRMSLQAGFTHDRFGITVTEQYIDSMVQSRVAAVVPGHNHIPAIYYTAVTLNAKFMDGKLEPFLTVNNVFDKQAPLIPLSRGVPNFYYPSNQLLYDTVGRFFTVGVRARF